VAFDLQVEFWENGEAHIGGYGGEFSASATWEIKDDKSIEMKTTKGSEPFNFTLEDDGLHLKLNEQTMVFEKK